MGQGFLLAAITNSLKIIKFRHPSSKSCVSSYTNLKTLKLSDLSDVTTTIRLGDAQSQQLQVLQGTGNAGRALPIIGYTTFLLAVHSALFSYHSFTSEYIQKDT